MYLDGRHEQLSDGSLEFVGQWQLEDAGFINESLLNPTSTQQLQRCHSLEYNNSQHVTADCDEDPPIIVTPG